MIDGIVTERLSFCCCGQALSLSGSASLHKLNGGTFLSTGWSLSSARECVVKLRVVHRSQIFSLFYVFFFPSTGSFIFGLLAVAFERVILILATSVRVLFSCLVTDLCSLLFPYRLWDRILS